MNDDDLFRKALAQRITTYARQEGQVVSRIAEFNQVLDDLRKRRRAAEQMYKAEFGEDPQLYVTDPGDHERQDAETHSEFGAGPVGRLFDASWAHALTTVLGEAREPLHVKEIWRRMREEGFVSSTRDPYRSIVTVAIRTPGVVRAAPNTYTLAGGDA